MDDYLIWSHEHSAWWRPYSCGYTTHLDAAGRYSREDAIAICSTAHDGWRDTTTAPPELPVRLADAFACVRALAALAPQKEG